MIYSIIATHLRTIVHWKKMSKLAGLTSYGRPGRTVGIILLIYSFDSYGLCIYKIS